MFIYTHCARMCIYMHCARMYIYMHCARMYIYMQTMNVCIQRSNQHKVYFLRNNKYINIVTGARLTYTHYL